ADLMTVTDKFPRAQSLAWPRSTRNFALPVRLEQRVEPLAHQHARPIGGHVHLELAAHVDDRVRVGRFQYVAVLLDDGLVPGDELRGRTILLTVVSVKDLDELDGAVVDRRRRIEDDVPEAGRVFHIHGAAKRHVPGVAHLAPGPRLACSRDPRG